MPKLSKKKLRRMNRFTVAELKQVTTPGDMSLPHPYPYPVPCAWVESPVLPWVHFESPLGTPVPPWVPCACPGVTLGTLVLPWGPVCPPREPTGDNGATLGCPVFPLEAFCGHQCHFGVPNVPLRILGDPSVTLGWPVPNYEAHWGHQCHHGAPCSCLVRPLGTPVPPWVLVLQARSSPGLLVPPWVP